MKKSQCGSRAYNEGRGVSCISDLGCAGKAMPAEKQRAELPSLLCSTRTLVKGTRGGGNRKKLCRGEKPCCTEAPRRKTEAGGGHTHSPDQPAV